MASISFSGIDGSGKSTQIELFKRYLEKKKVDFEYIHLFSQNPTVSTNIQNKKYIARIIGSIRKHKNNVFCRPLILLLRLLNVLIDSHLSTRRNNKQNKGKLIVYDRYFYDILVIIAGSFPKLSNLIIGFAKLIPPPDIIVIFDSDPKTVIARKREHNLQDAKKLCNLYNQLADKLKITTISSEKPIFDIQDIIQKQHENQR